MIKGRDIVRRIKMFWLPCNWSSSLDQKSTNLIHETDRGRRIDQETVANPCHTTLVARFSTPNRLYTPTYLGVFYHKNTGTGVAK